MKPCKRNITGIVAGVLLAGSSARGVQAQSSDALLKKLVEKGILTSKEAQDLEKEDREGVKSDFVRGAGMPEWVKSVRLYGDFRGRFEQNNAENAAYIDRNRFRYRLRLGLTTSLFDNFEVGLRLASGNPLTNPGGTLLGGSPITANQDMNSLDSRKFLWIDAAYARWTAIKNYSWTLTGTIGKMDNPFQVSNMLFDYDLNPEGVALQTAYKISNEHTLKGNAGIFVLDEFNQGNPGGNTLPAGSNISPSHDPYFLGAQGIWEAKWTPVFESALGLSAFSLGHKDSLSARVQPFYNAGNTRDANGFLKYNINPVVGAAAATYQFESFPLYTGKFPVKVAGELMHNPGAPENNEGWRAGLTLGKAGKKGAWELTYRYQQLEADAWYDALVDDDNGAFYAGGNPQLAGTGKSNGWFGGTNVRGHQVVAVYSLTDFLNFTFTYYANELIINVPSQKNDAGHFMVDLNWRF